MRYKTAFARDKKLLRTLNKAMANAPVSQSTISSIQRIEQEQERMLSNKRVPNKVHGLKIIQSKYQSYLKKTSLPTEFRLEVGEILQDLEKLIAEYDAL